MTFKLKPAHRKWIGCLSALALTLALMAGCWIAVMSRNGGGSFLQGNVLIGALNRPLRATTVSLSEEEPFTASFVAYDSLESLGVWLRTQGSTETGYLQVGLYDAAGEQLFYQQTDLKDIKNGDFTTVLSDMSLPDTSRTVLMLWMRPMGLAEGTHVLVYQGDAGGTALLAQGRHGGHELFKIYVICCALLFAALASALFFGVILAVKPHWRFLATAPFLLLLASLLLYPGTACDESAHYIDSYRMANAWLGMPDEDPAATQMRVEDAAYLSVRQTAPTLEGIHIMLRDFGHRNLDNTMTACTTVPHDTYGLTHMPAAAGIAVARLLHLNAVTTYYAARSFTMLLYLVLGCLALWVCPGQWSILFLFLINPLVLNMCTSTNQDGVILPIAFLMIAWYWHCSAAAKSEHRNLRIAEWIVFVVLEALLLNCKIYGLLGLPFLTLLPIRQNRKKINWPKLCLLAVCLLVGLGVCWVLFSRTYYATAIYRVLFESSGIYYSLSDVLAHPLAMLGVFGNTIRIEGLGWITSAFGSRISWETYLPAGFAVANLVILCIAAIPCAAQAESCFSIKEKALSWAIMLVLFLAVAVRALMWTQLGSETLYGIQGRYFLPVLPLIFFSLGSRRHVTQKSLASCSYMLGMGWSVVWWLWFSVVYLFLA